MHGTHWRNQRKKKMQLERFFKKMLSQQKFLGLKNHSRYLSHFTGNHTAEEGPRNHWLRNGWTALFLWIIQSPFFQPSLRRRVVEASGVVLTLVHNVKQGKVICSRRIMITLRFPSQTAWRRRQHWCWAPHSWVCCPLVAVFTHCRPFALWVQPEMIRKGRGWAEGPLVSPSRDFCSFCQVQWRDRGREPEHS